MSEIMFSHQKRVKKVFFSIWPLTRGSCFAKIRVSFKPSKWTYRDAFLTPHFWPFKNHWTCQKSCFLIRRGVKKPFFYLTSPRGSCFAKIRVSCQTFKMDIQGCFFLIPHFWPFKNHWTCQNYVFSSEEGSKSLFFYPTSPQGVLFCQIRVSCQTFKMDIQRCFFLTPIFDHLKTTGHVRNHVFSSEEG